ncbi:MAG: aminoglycoside phosphotransferase family protein [Candidatus Liptonbacteria bacterium]|nr:aminoglycoside phosphotransferase family protein [Candidatus Liptonbacteria bacterium]
MSKPLKYSKQLDGAVIQAAEEALKISVLNAAKIMNGSVNHVYRVCLQDGSVVAVRVFGEEFWPPNGKLALVERMLDEHEIAHARILHHTRDNRHFPYGFMITEFVEGTTCSEAIGTKISSAEFYGRLGRLLKKVHRIKFPVYGDMGEHKKVSSDFVTYMLRDIENCLDAMEQLKLLDSGARMSVYELVQGTLQPHVQKFEPVLVHWDAGPENCVLRPDGELVLVDWDNAQSHIWIQDYAVLTYWKKGGREKVRTPFLETHGLGNFTLAETDEIEKALHALFAAKLLPYFYHHKEDMEAVEATKNRLLALIR